MTFVVGTGPVRRQVDAEGGDELREELGREGAAWGRACNITTGKGRDPEAHQLSHSSRDALSGGICNDGNAENLPKPIRMFRELPTRIVTVTLDIIR